MRTRKVVPSQKPNTEYKYGECVYRYNTNIIPLLFSTNRAYQCDSAMCQAQSTPSGTIQTIAQWVSRLARKILHNVGGARSKDPPLSSLRSRNDLLSRTYPSPKMEK